MSVLIKGMDMPKTAFECSTKINPEERRCNFTGKVFEETLSLLTKRRCKDCPLVEIPTLHGRLIDADALSKKDINLADFPYNFIKVAPTIIEAKVNK